jgi:hypothetical protein
MIGLVARFEFLGVKVPRIVAARVRDRARGEDRTVSAYLRRLIIAALDDDEGLRGA